jgi:hypothetical protein
MSVFITRSADHHYTFRGVTYRGTTGILKVLDKSDPMMAWASRKTAEAAIANIGALPQLLESVGPEGVVKALTARSAWTSEKAMDLGSEIHDMADRYVKGQEPVPGTEEATARVKAYAEWWKASGWTLRASEALLVNTVAGYGGTLDLLCRDADGRTVLADIKSGRIDYRGRVYDSIVLQLAAYGMAEWLQVGAQLYPMVQVDRYAVVHVTADGVKEVEVPIGQADHIAFLACVELAKWRESRKGKRL